MKIKPSSIVSSILPKWIAWWGEARTRILLYYVALMLGFIILGLPLMKQQIFASVDERVREDLEEDIADFGQLLRGELTAEDRLEIARSVANGRSPFTSTPQTEWEVETIFEVYFNRRVPEDDTFLIAIINGKFYKSSPRALPEILQPNGAMIQQWRKIEEVTPGEPELVDNEIDSVLYIIKPIKFESRVLGLLVAAHTVEGEQEEALETLGIVFRVIGLLSIFVLILAWWLSGRVLLPLRALAVTAHQIGESDLAARIPAVGNGEIADLTRTFNEMMDRLESAFDTQRKFINDAGHELRTPITIVSGHLELMGDDPAERAATIELVMDELDRMNRLVNDLILLAKSERLDFLQPEQVDIATLTEDLFSRAEALGDRYWRLATVGQGQISIDRQRIIQAMMNLAQNAVQHTDCGAEIAIGSNNDGRWLRLWVKDSGEGIAVEEQEQIFLRFARSKRNRRKSDGSGLGLSIVKAIAEAHHGQVLLSSQLEQGATFTLLLPMRSRRRRSSKL